MYIFLISFVWGLFVAMLFLNLYFRIRVMKSYGILVKAKVQFDASHVFNREKLEREILPKYPDQKADIENFVKHIHFSIKMATVLTTLITAFAAILMYYR
ncbi:MAG: hypothetical protein ACOYOA_12130 [Saprospiraceae bacterium]